MKKITSIDNPTIKKLIKLKQKKYRDQLQQCLIEGEHLVYEAKHSHCIDLLIVIDESQALGSIPTLVVTEMIMKKLSSHESSPKIIALISYIKREIDYSKPIIVLDNIQDPGNLGSIIRSAVAFNLTNIILTSNGVDLYNSKVINSTQGALFKINVETNEFNQVINKLKQKGYQTIGSSLLEGLNLTKTSTTEAKSALFLGN
ncbi:MAG: TrmH family RNA methyltransferase, partial [Bacilli bacterium]